MSAPFRIAVITTEYRENAHADVIVSRWVEPRPTDSLYGWGAPRTSIASLYVHQIPHNDLSEGISKKHGIPRFETVEGALTLGGDALAVDAVLLIAEHGEFPLNEFRQKLYPRKELFDQVVSVFRKSGRVVPIFFDKHFSWNPAFAHEMYWAVRDLEIPFFGGSSITHVPLSAPVDPAGKGVREIVGTYWDSLEAYLFHNFELVQSVTESCRGGASSPATVEAWEGEAVWQALDRGAFSVKLLESSLQAGAPEEVDQFRLVRSNREARVAAFQVIYRNGVKETHFWHPTLGRKFAFACEFEDGEVAAAHTVSEGKAHFFSTFASLNRKIEDFFLSGVSPIPLDRLYLTTLQTAAAMRALAEPGQPRPADWIELPVPREIALPG